MDKKLVLHIGTPKTATTSLQNYFINNKKFLNKNSVYPLFTGDRINNDDFYKRFMKGNEDYFHDFFLKSVIKNGIYIFSCELLYTMPKSYDLQFSYIVDKKENYVAKKEKLIKRLSDFFLRYFDEIEVVIVFRNQVEFLNSNYIQDVQYNYKDSIEKYLHDYSFELDYKENLLAWQKFFPCVDYFVFEGMLNSKSVEYYFCRRYNLPYNFDYNPIVENKSISTDLFLFKRDFNKVFYTSSHRAEAEIEKVFYGHIDRALDDLIAKGDYKKHREISTELSREIFDRYRNDNLELFGNEVIDIWKKVLNKSPSLDVSFNKDDFFNRFFYETELTIKYLEKDMKRMFKDSADWNYAQEKTLSTLIERLDMQASIIERFSSNLKDNIKIINEQSKDIAKMEQELENIRDGLCGFQYKNCRNKIVALTKKLKDFIFSNSIFR